MNKGLSKLKWIPKNKINLYLTITNWRLLLKPSDEAILGEQSKKIEKSNKFSQKSETSGISSATLIIIAI